MTTVGQTPTNWDDSQSLGYHFVRRASNTSVRAPPCEDHRGHDDHLPLRWWNAVSISDRRNKHAIHLGRWHRECSETAQQGAPQLPTRRRLESPLALRITTGTAQTSYLSVPSVTRSIRSRRRTNCFGLHLHRPRTRMRTISTIPTARYYKPTAA